MDADLSSNASGNQQAQGKTLANLALLDCVLGHLPEGRDNARLAIALSEQAGDKINLANAVYYVGRIELADRNFPAAETALLRALNIRHEAPTPGVWLKSRPNWRCRPSSKGILPWRGNGLRR